MDETQQRVGGYTIVRKLGEGGMGVVYLATDTRLGRPVALKVLRRELAVNAVDRDRFQREARSAATVEHDNIVPVYDVGETAEGGPFIAMPLLKGESLDARLRRDPVAPVVLVLKVAEDVASGLAAAHAAGLVHRDIKPANIWLEGDPGASDPTEQVRRCKILDFGLARFVAPGDAQLTGSGVILGTPAYMAPEQARGERVDHRADLFSLGVVLYRMATGQPPFAGTTPLSFLVAVTTDAPPPARAANPTLPPALADLIDRLLSRAPSDRPQSAADVVRAARDIRTRPDPASTSYPQLLPLAEEQSDPDTVPDPRPRPPASRGRWVLVAAALLALVPLGAWLAGAFNGGKPDGTVAKSDAPQPPTDEQPKPAEVPKPAPPVVPEPKAAPAVADPDRTAALWVIGIGGCVCVNGEGGEISSANGLPTEPFQLTALTLTENAKARDADFAKLAGCRHLFTLGLSGAPVGDTALTHLRGSPVLMYVYLKGTRITSAGLTALGDCTAIQELDLSYTQVDDDGLKHLARLSKLSLLYLVETKVTPAGVADLARALPGCQITWNGGVEKPDPERKAALWVLSAGGSVHVNGDGQEVRKADKLPKEPFKLTQVYLTDPVKDADLEALAGCKNLTSAYLVGTGITTEGLTHLKDCKKLTSLNVSGTMVCDQAVLVIKGFAKLEDLSVGRSAVTEDGVKQLAKALPGCRIQHDGGTTGPTKKK